MSTANVQEFEDWKRRTNVRRVIFFILIHPYVSIRQNQPEKSNHYKEWYWFLLCQRHERSWWWMGGKRSFSQLSSCPSRFLVWLLNSDGWIWYRTTFSQVVLSSPIIEIYLKLLILCSIILTSLHHLSYKLSEWWVSPLILFST